MKKTLTKKDVDTILEARGEKRSEEVKIAETGENAHRTALLFTDIAQKLDADNYIAQDEDADLIIQAFALWTGHDIKSLIEAAQRKDGYALFKTDLLVSDDDLQSIKASWEIIKGKGRAVLESPRFSTEIKDADYPTKKENELSIFNRIENAIDGVKDNHMQVLDCVEFIDRVCSGYYGKLDKETQGPEAE